MALNSFADVKVFFNQIMNADGVRAGLPGSPHHDFWNTLSYTQFTTGNVPGAGSVDPNTGNPISILVIGNSGASNIIAALQGTGPIFGPAGIGRMPAGFPAFTDVQIAELADWIDRGCPQ